MLWCNAREATAELCVSQLRHPLVAAQGYLAALSASAYSYVSMLQRFGPIMNPGGAAISLTYLASEKIIPGELPTPLPRSAVL